MTPTSRRELLVLLLATPVLGLSRDAAAQSGVDRALQRLGGAAPASALSAGDATGGIKEALAKGVESAILQLGRPNGFFADAAVKILVPDRIRQVADLARKAGQGARVDAFEESMNRAAEKAVPAAADILGGAVRDMSVQDAVGIVRGGGTSATDYFRKTSNDKLYTAFRPIVARQTASVGVTEKYKAFADKTGGGAVGALFGGKSKGGASLDLDDYVTNKAIDGLFHVIGSQEQQIRSNPAARSTDLLRRVFG
jgi:hypothetical protein